MIGADPDLDPVNGKFNAGARMQDVLSLLDINGVMVKSKNLGRVILHYLKMQIRYKQ